MLVLIPSALTRGVVVSTGRRQVDDEPTENSSDEDAATDHDRGVAADEGDVGLAGEVPSDFLRQIRESMAEVSKDVLPPDYLSPISKSITSGFQLSDSLTGLFTGRLLPNIDRIGSTPGGTFFAQSESKLSAFVTGLDAQSKFQVPALARSFAENTAAIGLSPLVRALPEGLFPSDLGLGRALAMQELVATSAIADLLGRDKLLGSWRQSLLSEATARSLVGTMRVSGASEGILRDIVRTNVATARVVERFAELNKSQMFLPAVSVRPTRELRSFLDALPLTPIAGALDFASQASRGVAGLTAADLLVIDGTISDGAIDLFEDEVVEPWMSGAYTSRSVLVRSSRCPEPPKSPICCKVLGGRLSATGPAQCRWPHTPPKRFSIALCVPSPRTTSSFGSTPLTSSRNRPPTRRTENRSRPDPDVSPPHFTNGIRARRR